MKPEIPDWAAIEPERYELQADYEQFLLDRREFLGTLGGLIILCMACRESQAQRPGGNRRGAEAPRAIGAWLHITEDGRVTGYTGKVEIGQNARTSLSQAIADELSVPIDSVSMIMGDTSLVPFDVGTFGSLTTPTMVPQLRKASAAAREILIGLAADRWKVDRSSISLEGGKAVCLEKNASAGFGELTRGRKLVERIGDDDRPTPGTNWKVAGRSHPKIHARDMVTGRHRYTSDLDHPGMLRGKVLRPRIPGEKLASVDTLATEAMDGVNVVRDGDFVGITARTEFEASRALSAIKAVWTRADVPPADEFLDTFRKALGDQHREGHEVCLQSPVSVEAEYTIAYIAHAPLEPRAALAVWEGDRLTVWAGTQRPFGVRSELANAFGMPEEMVRVIVPDTGSGYGGKHTGESAIEAARLAKATGRPVKLVWTREEEFQWAYARPAGLIAAAAGADRDGKLAAWSFHNVNSGTAGLEPPYRVANKKAAFYQAKTPIRQGSYRALASTANHFARESLMDELAAALKLDPLEFRLRNLENPRLKAVLEAGAERFGWGREKPADGKGFGLACGADKGGFVATFAEIERSNGPDGLRAARVVAAFECGAIANPDQLRNQIEGMQWMGLGGALFETLRLENGAIRNGRFSRYRVPRLGDLGPVDVVLVNRPDLPPAGAGEIPIVGIAPAIANAFAAATGNRIRSMPMAAGRVGEAES
ncbi:MAG: molybdopterin cofactor-binding domain-containing protein [Isosphaeraceae bacterium]